MGDLHLQPVGPRHSSPPPGICLDEFGYYIRELIIRLTLPSSLCVELINVDFAYAVAM